MPNTITASQPNVVGRQSSTQPLTSEFGGPQGEKMVGKLHADYFEQTQAAQHYWATVATAAAIPIQTSTTFVLCLFNPFGSGVLLTPTLLNLGYVATTEVPGNVLINFIAAAGAQVATGSPILTGTAITPQNCRIGATASNKGLPFSAGTLTAATTLGFTTGISQYTVPAAGVAPSPVRSYDFKGSIVMNPGTAIFVMANAATGATYQQTIFWYETVYV